MEDDARNRKGIYTVALPETSSKPEYRHRQFCSLMNQGCDSSIGWVSNSEDVDKEKLIANGWQLDHGMWVCPLHAPKK